MRKNSRGRPLKSGRPAQLPEPSPELAQLPGRLVHPDTCRNLPGVSVIPMGTNRAFLALEGERGVADLELAILDRLDDPRVSAAERRQLRHLRARLRDWRRSSRLRFSTRSIILVEDRGLGTGRSTSTGRPV